MQFALSPFGKRIGPRDGPWGYCPKCGEFVTAKRGEIVHHFAHQGAGIVIHGQSTKQRGI
jgi:hypothetical protein